MEPVSIVIPAYNEEHGLGPVLAALLADMAQGGGPFEIIVVDDGSKDDTAVIAAQYPVTLLRHRVNKGYGAALKTGIRHAQHDLICITDADGTYPNTRIPQLVNLLVDEGYDMVVGARIGENVQIPLVRRPAKWALGRLAAYVANEPIPDLNSGLRVFRREVAMRFFNILPNQFSFTTTITLAMLTNQYLVLYVPIDYFARVGKSKIRPIHDTINFMKLVLRIGLYFAPLKLFLPLSLWLLILGIAWGTSTLLVTGQIADISTLVIVMTAFQVFVIGLLAELINRRMPNDYRE
ncbi:MAG: glycosyltransferase family 2 protein [Chloroflexi bacterium]|nr:glycosyltransferase family 2 protein [Chloroflexota bacterium]MBP7044144.1 glycosyltransferase family 2 protein [Chloroflexota bacterium]